MPTKPIFKPFLAFQRRVRFPSSAFCMPETL
nr:MAG TPA: hypothetical protein [Bacteriophage sp.]